MQFTRLYALNNNFKNLIRSTTSDSSERGYFLHMEPEFTFTMHLDLCSLHEIHIDHTITLKTNKTGASSSETIFLPRASPHYCKHELRICFWNALLWICAIYILTVQSPHFQLFSNQDFWNVPPSVQCTLYCAMLCMWNFSYFTQIKVDLNKYLTLCVKCFLPLVQMYNSQKRSA